VLERDGVQGWRGLKGGGVCAWGRGRVAGKEDGREAVLRFAPLFSHSASRPRVRTTFLPVRFPTVGPDHAHLCCILSQKTRPPHEGPTWWKGGGIQATCSLSGARMYAAKTLSADSTRDNKQESCFCSASAYRAPSAALASLTHPLLGPMHSFLLNAGSRTGVGAPARRRGGGPTSLARPRDYPWRPQMRGLSCLASRASTALDRRSPLTRPVTHHGHAAKTSREPPLPGLPSRLFPFPVRATQQKNMAPPPRSLLALAAAAVAAGGVAAFMPPVTEDGWYQGEKPERERGLARTRA